MRISWSRASRSREACSPDRLRTLALRCYRELDDDAGIATMAYDSGTVYRELGRFDEDLTSLDGALAVFRTLRDRFGEALTLRTLGELYLAEQALDKAAQYLGAALTRWDDLNSAPVPGTYPT
jgi:tetratricopeptide (TPR) repeat protein